MTEQTPKAEVNENAVDENTVLGPDGQPLSKKQLKKLEKEREKAAKKAETQARLEAEKASQEGPDFAKDRYGKAPLIQSKEDKNRTWTKVSELDETLQEKKVLIRARLHNVRAQSKNAFIILRQRTDSVQGVLTVDEEKISRQMIKFVKSVGCESIVEVEGIVKRTLEPVKSCTLKGFELSIESFFVISEAHPQLPIQIDDASRSKAEIDASEGKLPDVSLDTRLNNRVIELRTIANQAIFRLQSNIVQLFREFLISNDFMEIHSPKLIGAASEGGANVFSLKYFDRQAYLAQSPQLYKQMVICADFERVFEIAPVFRAENSNSHRHMTEFVGLDLEMAFKDHYHEVLYTIARLMNYIFRNLKERYQKELSAVKSQYPFEDFLFLEEPLVLKFSEGIAMLRSDGVDVGDFDDLNTENEKRLGRLVREKYKTDFYVLDKFPLAIRPFYTMPDPSNKDYSNSYDFFMRGEEILSGAQRIHDPALLEERAQIHNISFSTIQGYLDAFKFGAPPHAGGGIGLERVLMLYLNLGNIRRTSLFPRDPSRLTP